MRAFVAQNLNLWEDLLFLADSLGSQTDLPAVAEQCAELRHFMCVFFCANDYADLKGEVHNLVSSFEPKIAGKYEARFSTLPG